MLKKLVALCVCFCLSISGASSLSFALTQTATPTPATTLSPLVPETTSSVGTSTSPEATTTPITTSAEATIAQSAIAPTPVDSTLKGVWVSTVYNLDYPSKGTVDSATLKKEADAILNHVQAMGMNAVFLQIRPTGDALYKSDVYPWSKYLTGKQGVAPQNDFDPLAYWVESAHMRGLTLHAWLNPYRVTNDAVKATEDPFKALSDKNPAKLNPSLVVRYTDGKLFYNPGLPQVREMIVKEVVSIISRYQVDGIHFDDYFYPGADFKDGEAYKLYGAGMSLDDWRRDNNNQLIRSVYQAIKTTKPNVQFGVSPAGIWANKKNQPEGSETTGNESYYSHYADTRRWVKEGVLDYIMPQIYWHIGFAVADYSKLLNWWQNVTSGTNVKLYIGLAAYRSGDKVATSPWSGDDEIIRQLNLNRVSTGVSGSVFFRYKFFVTRPSLDQAVRTFYGNLSTNGTKVPLIQGPIGISNPARDFTTNYQNYYVSGVSDANFPLYLNGVIVTNRSPRGYFGVFVPLKIGTNRLVFTQGAKSITRVITRGGTSTSASISTSGGTTTKPGTATPAKPALEIVIVKTSTFPQSPEFWLPGETVTLSCVAPVGAAVTATVGGQAVNLVPKTKGPATSKIVHTTYSAAFKMPLLPLGIKSNNLGAPIYTMVYNGNYLTQNAPGTLEVVSKESPYTAEVVSEDIDTFFYANTSKGAAYLLSKGMQDAVTARTGNMLRIGSGKWVRASEVNIINEPLAILNVVTGANYQMGEKYDILELKMTKPMAVSGSLSAGKLVIDIANTTLPPVVMLPQGSLATTATNLANGNRAQYEFSFTPSAGLNGYYVEKTSDGVKVYLKRPVKIMGGDLPLTGISVLIDPGHGGKDPGALGILGVLYAEKHINLATSIQLRNYLQSLGATVYMTRDRDVDLSLQERLRISYKIKPDMFISMHANSIGPDVNITNTIGFSVHYKDEVAKTLANKVQNQVINALFRKSRGVKVDNFYVVRGTWAPSILLETGFVPNPIEFDWLTDSKTQAQLAKEISNGILAFFTNY